MQLRDTRFILNYPRDMSYTERLVKTDILPLDLGREISDLSRNGLVSTNVNNFLSTFLPRYQTARSFDPNNSNLIFKYKQDYYRKSHFIRSAELNFG